MKLVKRCYRCKNIKSIKDFYVCRSKPDGLQNSCKDCSRLNNRMWTSNNKEKVKEFKKKYYYGDIDTTRKHQRDVYARNSENRKASIKKYRDSNPDKVKQWRWNRNYKLRINTGDMQFLTASEWNSILLKYNNTCLGCGMKSYKLTIDHVIPVSLGGTNTIDNIQPLCSKCNSKKHTKIIDYRVIYDNQ